MNLKFLRNIGIGSGFIIGLISGLNSQTLRFGSEFLNADDISYEVFDTLYVEEYGKFDLSVQLTYQNTSIDYQSAGFPIDITTEAVNRNESYWGLNLTGGVELLDRFTLNSSVLVSDGFSSHTSIWLDEYYRQIWTGRNVKGDTYNTPDPNNKGFSIGGRWEYIRSNAFLDLQLGYNRVQIAPGYEFEIEGEHAGELVRGVEELDVYSLSLSSENNITRFLKVRQAFIVSNTTQRDPRFTYSSEANVALSDQIFLRASGIYSKEGSDFISSIIRSALIYRFNRSWSIEGIFSLYRDNGEIEQSNLATDAAPNQKGTRSVLGLRWDSENEKHQLSLQYGIYEQKYGSLGIDRRFEPLYQDREWDFIKVAYSYQF